MNNLSIAAASRTVFKNIKRNILTILQGIKIKRDPSIWLFGAWMGNRFADNSRFLFQYLAEQGEKYGISEVIWATRSENVYNEVTAMGYKAVIIGTKESNYYHLIAGVHIICNSAYTDIDSDRSAGAIKIQLWHGVGGCKAVGRLNRDKTTIKQTLADIFIWPFYTPGNWHNSYYLASSKENRRIVKGEHGCRDNHIFEAITPRLCPCVKYKPDEIKLIEKIIEIKKNGKKVILYLPTFRTNVGDIIYPLAIKDVQTFIKDNHLLWLQKQHFVASDNLGGFNCDGIVNLSQDFDVNTLYDYIDLLITDYSSAASDAIFHGARTMEYCPDMDDYVSSNRKFVADFSLYHPEKTIIKPEEFLQSLIERLEPMTNQNKNRYQEVKNLLFDSHSNSYDDFMIVLLRAIKLRITL